MVPPSSLRLRLWQFRRPLLFALLLSLSLAVSLTLLLSALPPLPHFAGGLYRLLLSWGLPGLLLLFAILVPTLPNPIHSLLSLLGLFGATTILFLSQGAEYLAFVFLIVYVGALAILFLFVIMLLNVQEIITTQGRGAVTGRQLLSVAIGLTLFIRLLTILQEGFETHLLCAALPALPGEVRTEIGATVATDIRLLAGLYGEEAPLFLLVTVILLLAMLGAIVLAVGDQDADSQ